MATDEISSPATQEISCLGVKGVAAAPFELKLGPKESYGRAASVNPPPGAKKA